jgi:hypothetical protein
VGLGRRVAADDRHVDIGGGVAMSAPDSLADAIAHKMPLFKAIAASIALRLRFELQFCMFSARFS